MSFSGEIRIEQILLFYHILMFKSYDLWQHFFGALDPIHVWHERIRRGLIYMRIVRLIEFSRS